MMRISERQCAIINSAVKPFKLTSKFISDRLQHIIQYYAKYFSRRRRTIIQYTPVRKHGQITLKYNRLDQRGGFIRKQRPIVHNFHGVLLETTYGRNLRLKKRKAARKLRRNAKKSSQNAGADVENVDRTNEINDESEIASSISKESDPLKAANCSKVGVNGTPDDSWDLDTYKSGAGAVPNEEDIRNGTPKHPITEKRFQHLDEDSRTTTSMISESTKNSSEQMELEEIESNLTNDINEKIRQQLQLLKSRKSDLSLISTKSKILSADTREIQSRSRRSSSNDSKCKLTTTILPTVDALVITSDIQGKSQVRASNDANKKEDVHVDNVKDSKLVSGMINSLFNKLKSMNQSDAIDNEAIQTRLRANSAISTPIRRTRKDDSLNKSNLLSNTNLDDSNQSSSSVSFDFHGFDISNKNVDVSALLPTPKVTISNSQSAFISEDLNAFLKENSLEKGIDISIKPKLNTDEALMTTDALPPTLAVPERPMDMQRPRTLAEKRMILQQQSDVSIMIIENESTVYHELKKRVRAGSSYDNSSMQRVQDVNVPFTRDCWRAACWVATANNRFFYRTIIIDDEEIKLNGSRGDNPKKVSFNIKTRDVNKISPDKYLPPNCSRICLPIKNIKINDIDEIIADIKQRYDNDTSLKIGSIFGETKKAKLNLFSREYLAPGPKCKKPKCKWNRTTSFDLEYGPIELLYLPKVQLEVWPQIGLPLPEHVKPLMKKIVPEMNVITSELARFAVSVIKEMPKPQTKHRRKYRKPEPQPPESFIFDIPYENNEKKVLIRRRRRSSIIFDKNDAKYEKIESFYLDKNDGNFNFKNTVDTTDSIAIECADILADMIESVAHSVNESNFTKPDPDIDYIGKLIPVADLNKKSQKTGNNKTEKDKTNVKTENAAKMKLMKELKRLDVTVINTDETTKAKRSSESCQKTFCRLGCICESIESPKFIPTHCNRIECMFECSCAHFEETNNYGFDSNLGMLQARANARLAKVEKEFKSTIVVSENNMFVLPNTSTATKRNSKKPKRFASDESCFEDTESETIWKSKRRRPATDNAEIKHHRINAQQRINLVKSMQHVRVVAEPLPDLDIEPWCMIHCLYKCHCKGKSQKGRAFNFTNKKSDLPAHTLGGWEVISPRKRQYTFERELISAEPITKTRKMFESTSQNRDQAARTIVFDWKRRPRKTAQQLKTLKNTCLFNENPYTELLKERIKICRNYNKEQNMLMKSMENGQFLQPMLIDRNSDEPNGSTTKSIVTAESVSQLNDIISDTMQRLTTKQRQNKYILTKSMNKLSIVCWDRALQAIKDRELFVWNVTLVNNNRALLLTDSFVKPQNSRFTNVSNINYMAINELPMLAKLLRISFCNENTKYLAMLLLRLSDFWRILGVVHSDLKYLDDELIARPTPTENPLLSQKINTLYQLLTNQSQSSNESLSSDIAKNIESTVLKKLIIEPPAMEDVAQNLSSSFGLPSNNTGDDADADDDDQKPSNTPDVDPLSSTDNMNFFENASMRLSLPIPVKPKQRLLMVNLGDDFTHIWFPTWRKFLSLRRIQNALSMAKNAGKVIEMSLSINVPKVFVSNLHDNQIFIGPYGSEDRQNIALFIRHNNHMVLAEEFHESFGVSYTKKSKAQWVYPNPQSNGESTSNSQIQNSNQMQIKINQVFSKLDLPADYAILDSIEDDSNDKDTFNNIESNRFDGSADMNEINWMNGTEEKASASTSIIPSNSESTRMLDTDAQLKRLFSVPKIRLIKTRIIQNGNKTADESQILNPLPFKISSVASGDSVAFMTNGLSSGFSEDSSESKHKDDLNLIKIEKNDDDDDVDDDNVDNVDDAAAAEGGLLIPKSEPIDISDTSEDMFYGKDEIEDYTELPLFSLTKSQGLKGYIYCSTNIQLGKIHIEWTSETTISLNLQTPTVIECEDTVWQRNMPAISSYMQSYIRKHFYAVYPAHLRLDWIFIKSKSDDDTVIELSDFNKLNRFSVVFKEKIVSINSNYLQDETLSAAETYVLDIFKLASQLLKDDEVKFLTISDILRRARQIDHDLSQRQAKLNKRKNHYLRLIEEAENSLMNNDAGQTLNGSS